MIFKQLSQHALQSLQLNGYCNCITSIISDDNDKVQIWIIIKSPIASITFNPVCVHVSFWPGVPPVQIRCYMSLSSTWCRCSSDRAYTPPTEPSWCRYKPPPPAPAWPPSPEQHASNPAARQRRGLKREIVINWSLFSLLCSLVSRDQWYSVDFCWLPLFVSMMIMRRSHDTK